MAYAAYLHEAAFENQLPLKWSEKQVGDWVESLGFPQYRACFEDNFICGRLLIHVNTSTLPLIGVSDFKHMLALTSAIRELLKQESPDYTRSISLPPTNPLGLYLEQKAPSRVSLSMSWGRNYSDFRRRYKHKLRQWYGDSMKLD